MKDKPKNAESETRAQVPAPAPAPTPAPAPVPPDEGFKGEKKLKLRMKSQVNVEGIIYQTGDEVELPERQALSLVGSGVAEELPGTAPAP